MTIIDTIIDDSHKREEQLIAHYSKIGSAAIEQIDKQKKRIAELEAENQRLANMKSFSHWADLKRDAERYRWLRDNYRYAAHIAASNTPYGPRIQINDEHIDEAMKCQ